MKTWDREEKEKVKGKAEKPLWDEDLDKTHPSFLKKENLAPNLPSC